MNINRGNRNYVFYDSSISETEVRDWLTDFLNQEYRFLIDTRGKFILSNDHLLNNCFIPILISGETPHKYYKYSNRERAKKIVSRILRNIRHGSEEDLIDIVEDELKGKLGFSDKLLGTYHHDGCPITSFEYSELVYSNFGYIDETKPYIKLYYKNFSYETDEELRIALSNCLAHEYFHFSHHQLIGDNFNKSSGKGAKWRNAVIEALADFFSISYSLDKYKRTENRNRLCLDLAKNRYNLWTERFDSETLEAKWPYAYAYCFFYENGIWKGNLWDSNNVTDSVLNGCREKFNDVLNVSKGSMKEAYQRLQK